MFAYLEQHEAYVNLERVVAFRFSEGYWRATVDGLEFEVLFTQAEYQRYLQPRIAR